jgi:hypothetical protein
MQNLHGIKETLRQLLGRMKLGILPPRYCTYKDDEAYIEFGVVCNLFKALSEEERAIVAGHLRKLHDEGEFYYRKEWVESRSEENGKLVVYKYPPLLCVTPQ